MAHGTAIASIVAPSTKTEPWIIDSGASDHMTGTRSFVYDYSPYLGGQLVKIVDGSFTHVAGVGTVWLNDTFFLSNVLHVILLSCNLLSISKVTTDQKCIVNFTPSSCVFQVQLLGRMIGSARAVSGLYYFVCGPSKGGCCHLDTSSSSSACQKQVMLLHYRLGHPSFSYLCRLFPSLFSNKKSFTCEICLLAKHTHVPFHVQNYWPSRPFSLIQSDLWVLPALPLSLIKNGLFPLMIIIHVFVGYISYVIKAK